MKGIKKAVGDYQRANRDPRSPWYGHIMYDKTAKELWTDVFYSIGHNNWKVYDDPNIVCIDREMLKELRDGEPLIINMRTVRNFIVRRYRK